MRVTGGKILVLFKINKIHKFNMRIINRFCNFIATRRKLTKSSLVHLITGYDSYTLLIKLALKKLTIARKRNNVAEEEVWCQQQVRQAVESARVIKKF